MTLVKPLFTLPDQVRKGDFVLKLDEGLRNPVETTSLYVVTPALADAFDRALGVVSGAIRDGRSHAAYLHGSFGSGKSHFMALLSLLLDREESSWAKPELHDLAVKHKSLQSAKLLQLHFHMIGELGIESAVFRRYVEAVRERHPKATLPGLFADEQLFADAARMLEELGDDAFFAPMNTGAADQQGWGDYAAAWDRARFERAMAAVDPKEREELFTALVRTRFSAYAQESRQFVDMDAGLAIMARHAGELGYHGIVLHLDELILWLSHRAGEVAWLHNEVQKMVKLVEARETARAVPIVSFIARQRDLADMVGREHAGAEVQRLSDSLRHWKDRFDTIVLEDHNLPAIVEKRVLVPKSDQARKTLDTAFSQLRSTAGPAWDTLLGQQDADAFRKLYPFSPALVETLVALSGTLQKQRTALKLLLELLVEHIEDLEVGSLVCVGDLFDVLAGADDPADGVTKARFDSAKQLYKYHLLPMLQQQHGTTTADGCQRERDGHPIRLGCASCPQRACRTDNRIVKTLLVAALVPEVKPLKDLTASRVAQLNHGTLKVPIAGTEHSQVAGKLRKWAAEVGQLRVGQESDPRCSVLLEGVDTKPILDAAREFDTSGARQRVIRDLLFDAFVLDKVADWSTDKKVDWRGTHRLGHLRFGNVRRLGPEVLRCADDHDWRLIVDYPFDDPGHGPSEDVEHIERFVDETGGSWTLVWLPDFFSSTLNEMLGDLVILEHVLGDTQSKRKAVAHLSVELQSRALLDLDNLRSQKRARILQAIDAVYGLTKPGEGDVDPGATVEKHLHLLKPGADLHAPLTASLRNALDDYVPAVLDARYPRHPRLAKPLSSRRVELLVDKFGELIDSDDKRLAADRTLVEEMRGTLQELGLVRVSENAVHLLEDQKLQDLERARMQRGVDQPTVDEVRRWIDESGKMGLQREAEDLVVRCYARWAARTLSHYDKAYTPKPGTSIPDGVVLEKPDLPSQSEWKAALDQAGFMLGVSLPGKALHADNLKRFEGLVQGKIQAVASPAGQLLNSLVQRCSELDLGEVDRLKTAKSADALCAALQGKKGVLQVEALASFEPQTSARAVGDSLATAADNARVLNDALVFGVFRQLRAKRDTLAGAQELLERLAKAIRQDEINEKLAARLRQLAEEGQRLLSHVDVDTGGHGGGDVTRVIQVKGIEDVRKVLDELERKGDEVVSLSGTLKLELRKRDEG